MTLAKALLPVQTHFSAATFHSNALDKLDYRQAQLKTSLSAAKLLCSVTLNENATTGYKCCPLLSLSPTTGALSAAALPPLQQLEILVLAKPRLPSNLSARHNTRPTQTVCYTLTLLPCKAALGASKTIYINKI